MTGMRKKRARLTHAFHALLLLAAAPAVLWAAADPVAITGRVVDENGAPVQSARISISAVPGVTGAPVVRTDSDAAGAFRAEIATPGTYQVRVEREGFFQFVQQSMALNADSPVEIRISHVKEMAESMDVNYSPPAIDPEQTSDTKQLHSPDIQNVPYPATQDYRSALPLMPGAIQDNSGAIHFNGGTTNETNYRLNGFDVSDPASGGLGVRMNVDTIQTIEWEASRFSPETGKGSAGTVEIRTQMGDDHWRYLATNFIPSFAVQDGFYLSHFSPRFIVSGPIKKRKIWFHNSFDTYYTANTITGLPSSEDRTSSLTATNLTRVQWNISDNQILTGSLLLNLGDSRNNGLSFLDPVQTTTNTRQWLSIATIKDQFIIGGGLLEFGFADTSGYFRSAPQGDQPYVITPFGASGNYFRNEKAWDARQEGMIHGYVRPVSWHGSHQIEIGTDVERSDLNQTILRHELSVARADGSTVRTVQFDGSPQQFETNIETYGYVLDKWSPRPNLTIEAGVRTQWDEYTGGAPPAPRLAASWVPKLLGGTKFSAGWGIFYNAVTLDMLALSQEQTSVSTYYSESGQQVGVPIESRFVLSPGALKLPRFAISSFTAERRLPWNVYARMNLISREGSRGFSFEQEQVNPSTNLYILDNIARERYRAAEFSFKRTFLSKYQWFASYTRSEARSNAVVNYSIEDPLLSPQAGGPLGWDAPNRVTTYGWAPLEKTWFPSLIRPLIGDTDLQILADWRTGFPFTATTETGYIVGMPNDLRFPDYMTLNVAFERRFPFHGYLWAFRVALINSLNRPNPNVVNSDFNSPQFMEFGRGQARAVNVRLRFIGRK